MTVQCVFAGEYVLFTSGSRMHVDRHEADEGVVRLYEGTGYTEMPAGAIAGFEPDGRLVKSGDLAAPVPLAAPEKRSPGELADEAADKYGLPRDLVRSVISAESGFQPDAVSPKGALGLMQLIPGTARDLGADPRDPAQNVDAGTRYLRDLLLKYDGLLWHALAAYNAGPGVVDRYSDVPPYRETVRYINRVDRQMRAKKAGRPNDHATPSAAAKP